MDVHVSIMNKHLHAVSISDRTYFPKFKPQICTHGYPTRPKLPWQHISLGVWEYLNWPDDSKYQNGHFETPWDVTIINLSGTETGPSLWFGPVTSYGDKIWINIGSGNGLLSDGTNP